MTMKEFAESRGIETQVISRYMSRHNMKYNKSTGLTKNQLIILEKKYPLPKPVELVEDTGLMRELIATQKELNQAKTALIQAQSLIAQAEAQKLLLEDREAHIEELKAERLFLEKELREAQEEARSYKKTFFGFFRKI